MTRARDLANIIGSGATSSGTITAATLAATTGVTFPDGSIPLVDLDIDGGTDIGAALVDADLMVVDDGAGGTNRKATMSRLATYMGTKVGGGSLAYIASSGAISNAANVSFTQFDASKYDHYQFWFQHVLPATDGAQLYGHVSTDGGSNYDTTNGNYHFNLNDAPGLIVSDALGTDTGESGVGVIFTLFAPHMAVYTYGFSSGVAMLTNSYVYSQAHATAHLTSQDTDAIQFKFNSGNVASGEIVMYGIANGT